MRTLRHYILNAIIEYTLGMSMILSIVIPARNEEHYIGQCLASIFKVIGDTKDIEVIVVDNGSTDRTQAVVKEQFPQVKIVFEPKPGTSQARESGFRASTGKLVAFLDSDTILPGNWISNVESEFRKHPKVVCLSGPYIYYDLPAGINILVRVYYFLMRGVYVLSRFVFHMASVVIAGNYVVRREALEAIGGHDVSITFFGDDTDIAKRMSKVGQVKFSFGFTVYSSGRRFAAEGLVQTATRYALNYFWIVIFGHPFSRASNVIGNSTGGKKISLKTVDWIFGFSALFAIIAITIGMLYGIYYVAESGVFTTISFIELKVRAQQEAQEFHDQILKMSSSTRKSIEKIIPNSGS
jgi:glycosyltransferase involved in cell wall biosynthesis